MTTPVVLMTSAGSLVGKVVLDALDGRRDAITLVACDASSVGANLQRCDRVYQVPMTAAPQWAEAILRIIESERPALVIPGRDDDVEELVRLAQSQDGLRHALLGGSLVIAEAISDKAQTAALARRHGLAYAPTVITGQADTERSAMALLVAHGFPLIAKPAKGSGSLGVRCLLSPDHLQATVAAAGYVIQPFLDPPLPIILDQSMGLPLFWEIPEERLYAVQYAIARDGHILGRLAQRARMVRGRVEEVWTVDDPSLLAVTDAFAAAVIAEGWRGPFNVQAKRDGAGWKVIELNGRFSGGTSSRLHLGFDEVAILINAWLDEPRIPPTTAPAVRHVVRQLSDCPLLDA